LRGGRGGAFWTVYDSSESFRQRGVKIRGRTSKVQLLRRERGKERKPGDPDHRRRESENTYLFPLRRSRSAPGKGGKKRGTTQRQYLILRSPEEKEEGGIHPIPPSAPGVRKVVALARKRMGLLDHLRLLRDATGNWERERKYSSDAKYLLLSRSSTGKKARRGRGS